MVLDASSWSETIGPMRKGENHSVMSHRGKVPALDSVRRDRLGVFTRSGWDSNGQSEPGRSSSLILSSYPLAEVLGLESYSGTNAVCGAGRNVPTRRVRAEGRSERPSRVVARGGALRAPLLSLYS